MNRSARLASLMTMFCLLSLAACAPAEGDDESVNEGELGASKGGSKGSSLAGAHVLPHLGPIVGAPGVAGVIQLDVWGPADRTELGTTTLFHGATTTTKLSEIVTASGKKVAALLPHEDGPKSECRAAFCFRLGPEQIAETFQGTPIRVETTSPKGTEKATFHLMPTLDLAAIDVPEKLVDERTAGMFAEVDTHPQYAPLGVTVGSKVTVRASLRPGYRFEKRNPLQFWIEKPNAQLGVDQIKVFANEEVGDATTALSFGFERRDFANAIANRTPVVVWARFDGDKNGELLDFDTTATPWLHGVVRFVEGPVR